MKKQNIIIRKVFIGMAALVCGVVLLGATGCSSDAATFKIIQQASEQVNKICPMKVDAQTTIESTEAIEPKTIKYNVVVKLPQGADTEALKIALQSLVVNQVKNDAGLKPLRDNNVTIAYCYKTSDGEVIADIVATPEDYK